MNFDDYFDQLRSDGSLDSSGVFTLDTEKVQWKLGQYQLANPSLFPLFLVKAAVVGGATQFERHGGYTREDPVHFHLHNLVFTRQSIQDLNVAALGGGQEVSRFLMTAFSVASHLGNVAILCYNQDDAFGLSTVNKEVQFLETVAAYPDFLGTIFRFEPISQGDAVGSLYFRARYAPVPLSFLEQANSNTITRADLPSSTFLVAVNSRLEVDRSLQEATDIAVLQLPAELEDFHYFCWHTNDDSRFEGLYRGVLYAASVEFQRNHFSGVFTADDCRLDVSFSGFVETDVYLRKLEGLDRLESWSLRQILRETKNWNDGVVELVLQALTGHPELAEEADVESFCQAGKAQVIPPGPDLLSFAKSLSSSALNLRAQLLLSEAQRRVTHSRTRSLRTGLELANQLVKLSRLCQSNSSEFENQAALYSFLLRRALPKDQAEQLPSFLRELCEVVSEDKSFPRAPSSQLHPSWTACAENVGILLGEDDTALAQLADDPNQHWYWRLSATLKLHRYDNVYELVTTNHDEFWANHRKFWYQNFAQKLIGKVSWKQQIALLAQRGISTMFNSTSQTIVAKLRHQNKEAIETALASENIFQQRFWRVLTALTVDWNVRHPRNFQRLWAQLLIQASLGSPGSSHTLQENLESELKLPLLRSNR